MLRDNDGGQDTLNAAAMTGSVQFDLQATRQWLGGAALDLAQAGQIENAVGGASDDSLCGTQAANILWGGAGADHLLGRGGTDSLRGGAGDDVLDGGAGSDRAAYTGVLADYSFALFGDVVVVRGPDGTDGLLSVESLDFDIGGTVTVADALARAEVGRALAVLSGGRPGYAFMEAYSGPVQYLEWQHIGSAADEVAVSGAENDFLNLRGGMDAADAGEGDDVVDGGTGSNFLSGGGGRDVFFLDARGGGVTWSTITDWQAGEQLSLWGWRPGVSLAIWSADAGAESYRGVTLHVDTDGSGTFDASVTWSGRLQAELPAPVVHDGLLWFT
jgi:serralysin